MMSLTNSIPVVILFPILAAATAALFVLSLLLKEVWNRTMPAVFGLKAVTYWQAVGLMVTSTLLFGGLVR